MKKLKLKLVEKLIERGSQVADPSTDEKYLLIEKWLVMVTSIDSIQNVTLGERDVELEKELDIIFKVLGI